jgi:diguanylate cyclase (GGDEF)-like protein
MRSDLLKKKKSLVNIFIILAATFLFSFLFIVFLSYSKYIEYKEVLATINNHFIPKIINNSKVFQHANSLIYATEKLNNSKTQASRRLMYRTILNEISQIKELENKLSQNNSFLNNNLKVIKNELDQLNFHIDKKLNIQKELENKTKELSYLDSDILNFYEKNYSKSIDKHIAINNWRIHFEEIVNLSYQSLSISRLNQLREIISREKILLALLKQQTSEITTHPFIRLKTFNEKLIKDNLDKKSLLNLRLQQLKINGKTTGHGNFVNSLIYDFAKELEFIAINYTQSVIQDSQRSQQKTKEQIELMIVYFILIFFILLLIIYYINHIIIKRLMKLNHNVQQKINGENIILKDHRNDEISRIAYSINYFSQKVYEQNKQLEELSLNDSLTNIANRRAFDIKLRNEINLIKRNDYIMSILLIDVDYFKLYNDTYGHQKGDECLQKISKTLKKVIKRELDLVARYGGEEFVCILSNCNSKNAQKTATKILTKIQALKIPHNTSKCSNYISISIGVMTLSKNSELNPKSIIENTDTALYKAKQNGRNQVIVYSP